MTTMRAEISGVVFRMSTTALMGRIKPGLLRRAEAEAEDIKAEFQRLANGELTKVRTGAFRDGVEIRPDVGLDDRVGYRIVLTDWKAKMLEYGTKPHIITPRRLDGVLAFEVEREVVAAPGVSMSSTDAVFATFVNHPGTKPYHVLRTAVMNVTERKRIRVTM